MRFFEPSSDDNTDSASSPFKEKSKKALWGLPKDVE